MKKKAGNIVILLLVILNVLVWLIFSPVEDELISQIRFYRTYAGEVIGSTVIILMSVSLFLSARPKWAEPFFGGLDKMYQTHRRVSTAAFLILFAHVLIVPSTVEQPRLGNFLAVIAFTGIVVIVLVTLAPKIPFLSKLTGETYDGWKNIHRYIGIFFILGFIHSLTVNSLDALIAISWVQIFFIIGTASYLYTEIFSRFFRQSLPYVVEAVDILNGSVTQVTMRAKKHRIKKQRAGQFLFVRFPGNKFLNESHPFTISSAPAEDVLRLTIKASGDFTRALPQALKAGDEAIVMGAYGMFDYKTGRADQIWIAGGIGLTPFLSFVRDMDKNLKHRVDFFYTVRHPKEALFLEELEEAAASIPGLNLHVNFSAVDGSLNVAKIADKVGGDIRNYEIYMCGPLPMVHSFSDQLMELSVSENQIHFEEFNFR